MRPRNLVCITLLAACHLQLGAQAPQVLTNMAPTGAAPVAQRETNGAQSPGLPAAADPPGELHGDLPDDPGQELLPQAVPEPAPESGIPVDAEAKDQHWAGDTLTLTGDVVVHYRDYVIRADSASYNRVTTELEADGHLQLTGGPNDVNINASHGDMRLNMHTARFYNVNGSQGVHAMGHTVVYSTPNPLLFSGRVLLQTGEGRYRIVDGSITNCRLPRPDWRIIAHSINLDDEKASTSNAFFEFLGLPIFYLPYLHHPANDTGRVSGFLTPVISNGSSIRGYTLGEQVYWAINRNMDMVVGAEYFSKRGWAPNGDFRYRGLGLDHLTARWNALLDRGVEEPVTVSTAHPTGYELVNQGGVDVNVLGRQDFSPNTRASGSMEYLSSYVYRLVFDDNYAQAISSQVASDVVFTHNHRGMIPSVWLDRFESFASTNNGNEVRILHLPLVRYDVLDRPLGSGLFYWGLGSSLGYLNRSEPFFHSRNVGRFDFYPHLSMPIAGAGWSFLPEVALRDTVYTISQTPRLTGQFATPVISHSPLNRTDLEASIDIRPPALERDYELSFWHRELRHVIEPELNYRYVGGIGTKAQDVLLFDTTDIASNVNEAGFSLTQRFYLRPTGEKSCGAGDKDGGDGSDAGATAGKTNVCSSASREWATWEVAQEYFIDPNFGGALIPGRRNVFDATLDLMAPTFLTSARNIAPITSRIRFEAIDNLRIQWDLAYDTIAGQLAADNVFAGYSFGRTTLGIGHALLNAVDDREVNGATATRPATFSTLKSQQIQPFLEIGKPSGNGLDLAVNGGYDFVQHEVQYGGVQAVYNWNCCGLTLGYRRFELGTVGSTSRDETQWLYSFTLANFGAVGDIRRSNSVFRDPTLPPAY
ncbi:MAG TPA: LPS assembly protein LptD [Terracidiphilus sp.]|nr:LPS assembly protein LptD [Terracidiphilus sp.]